MNKLNKKIRRSKIFRFPRRVINYTKGATTKYKVPWKDLQQKRNKERKELLELTKKINSLYPPNVTFETVYSPRWEELMLLKDPPKKIVPNDKDG